MHTIVFDTNVLVAALRSRRGASFAILSELGKSWTPLISVPLIFEYEAVAKREITRLKIPEQTVEVVIRAFCFYGQPVNVHFRFRPALPDPGDEFLLDLAIAGQADAIVTHNVRHFRGTDQFGINVLTPPEFLRIMKKEKRT